MPRLTSFWAGLALQLVGHGVKASPSRFSAAMFLLLSWQTSMTDEVNMASPLVRDVKSEILEDIIKIRLKTCILSQEFEQKNKK